MGNPANHSEGGFAAFISYSHVDSQTAKWLHLFLERYRMPAKLIGATGRYGVIEVRVGRIFRDRDELAAGGALGPEIEQALASSRSLIVLCSAASARSAYVQAEIEYYQRIGRSDRIIPVIVDGDPPHCFSPALRDHDRLGADLRAGMDGARLAALKVVAGVAGVKLDELVERDAAVVRTRRAIYLAAGAVIASVVIGLGSLWYSAATNARIEEGRGMIASAREMLVQGEVAPALALLEAASSRVRGTERDSVMRVISAWRSQMQPASVLTGASELSVSQFQERQYLITRTGARLLPMEADASVLVLGQSVIAFSTDGTIASFNPETDEFSTLEGASAPLPVADRFLSPAPGLAFAVGLYPGPTPGTSAAALVLVDAAQAALHVLPMSSTISREGFEVLSDCSGIIVEGDSAPLATYGSTRPRFRYTAFGDNRVLIQFTDAPASAAPLAGSRFVRFGSRRSVGEAPRERDEALYTLMRACSDWTSHAILPPTRLELPSFKALMPSATSRLSLSAEIAQADYSATSEGAPVLDDDFFPTHAIASEYNVDLFGAFRGGALTRDIAVCTLQRASMTLQGCSRYPTFGGYDLEPDPARTLYFVSEAGAPGLSFMRVSDRLRITPDQDMPMASRALGNRLAAFTPDGDHFVILGIDGGLWTYRILREGAEPSAITHLRTTRIADFTQPRTQSEIGSEASAETVIRVEAVADGRVALVRADGALAMVELSSNRELWRLPGFAGAASAESDVAFSPDGRTVGVYAGGALRVIDLDTGLLMAERKHLSLSRPIGNIAVSAPSTIVDQNYIIDPQTGRLRPVPGSARRTYVDSGRNIQTHLFAVDRIWFESDAAIVLSLATGAHRLPLAGENEGIPLHCLTGVEYAEDRIRSVDALASEQGCAFVRQVASITTQGPTESAAPPPTAVSRPGFACENAGTAIEYRICESPALGELDREMTDLFNDARRNDANNRQTLLDEQRQWLVRRNRCESQEVATEACLSAAYEERLQQLRR